MERIRIMLALAALAAPGTVCAAEDAAAPAVPVKEAPPAAAPAKENSLSAWFKHWQLALKKSAVESRYRKVRTTSVAAVRGAGQKGADPNKVAWKGGWSEKKAAERMKEREELSAAVDLIMSGKLAEAQAALDSFEKAHPASALLADVREAQGKLREMKGEPPPPEPIPAAAPVKASEPPSLPAPSAAGAEGKAPEAKPVQPPAPVVVDEAKTPETKTPEVKPAEVPAGN